MSNHMVSLLFLTFLSVDLIGCDDCAYQGCFCSNGYINCESKQLTKIPAIAPSSANYTTLDLDDNEITEIRDGNLIPGLQTITLNQNPVTSISDTAFNSCNSTLTTLVLTLVKFTRIPDAFHSLSALTSLTIKDASIQDWNNAVWINIGKTLTSLDLENVGLTSWPEWLKSLSRLTDLTLNDGSISLVPDDALEKLSNTLSSLSITNNSLSSIPKAFSMLKSLQNLQVQQNNIADLTWLPQESNLTTMTLGYNAISDADHLSNSLYPFRKSLSYVNLESNHLSLIPNLTFLFLLSSLDFTNNRIFNPNSGAVPLNLTTIYFSNNLLPAFPLVLKSLYSINELNLAYNSITKLQGADISSSIETVYLGYNLITELTDTSFPEACIISILHLNNNPIVAISEQAFKYLVELTSLDLRATRLTRMPLALSSVPGLYYFDMEETTNLVCTCQEKILEKWIVTMASSSVAGTCGISTIYDFFTKLSQSCP